MNNYLTISAESEISQSIKLSTFIGRAVPIKQNDDPHSQISLITHRHSEAAHVSYAYTLGVTNPVQKYSDDGEPSGTAGLPLLELLKHKTIHNALIVVVRYFGGVKLGTGGLKRAYSSTGKRALDHAKPVMMKESQKIHFQCSYSDWSRVELFLTNKQFIIPHVEYTDLVRASVIIINNETETVKKELAEITASRLNFEAAENLYWPHPID